MKRSVFLTTPLSGPLFMATAAFSSPFPPPSACFPVIQHATGFLRCSSAAVVRKRGGAAAPSTSRTTVWEKNIGDNYLFGG